jgi:hypothetical protein
LEKEEDSSFSEEKEAKRLLFLGLGCNYVVKVGIGACHGHAGASIVKAHSGEAFQQRRIKSLFASFS